MIKYVKIKTMSSLTTMLSIFHLISILFPAAKLYFNVNCEEK